MYVHAYTHTNDAFDPCERKLRVSSQKEFRNQTGRQKSKVGIYLNKSMLSKGASLVVQRVKRLPAMQETWVWSPGLEDPLEKGMAIHSSTLAWKLPWTEEPGGLQSMESQTHTWLSTFTSSVLSKGGQANRWISLANRLCGACKWRGGIFTKEGGVWGILLTDFHPSSTFYREGGIFVLI